MNKSTVVKVAGTLGAMVLVLGSYTFFQKTNKNYNIWKKNIKEIKDLVATKLQNNSVKI